jgi:hypothetical protein
MRPVTRPTARSITRRLTEKPVGGGAPVVWSDSKTLTIPIAQQAGAVSDGVYPILLGTMTGQRTDGRDMIIQDAAGRTVPHCRIEKRHIAKLDGAWIFYGSPTVLFNPNAGAEGTIYIGTCTQAGYRYVTALDVATGEYTDTLIDSTYLQADDHNQPAFCLSSTGKLITAYCEHAGPVKVKVAVNNNSLAGGFGSQILFAAPYQASYTNLFRLSAPNEIYLWTRELDSAEWYLSKSTNDGTSWSAPAVSIQSGQRANYAVFWGNDVDRIWIAMNSTQPNDTGNGLINRGIYCFYFTGTNYISPAGTTIGTSVTSAGSLPADAVLFTQDSSAIKRSVVDVIAGADGHPRMLYYVYPGGDEEANHELWHARWTGSAWVHHKVVDEGPSWATGISVSYPGAAQFDRSNINKLATCKTVSGKKEVQIYQTSDNGATWSKIVDVTAKSIHHNTRPKYPHGMTTTLANKAKSPHLFWMGNGEYVSLNYYKHAIKAYPADYTYGALVKVDLPGNADVPLTVRWGNPTNNGRESLNLFGDLGMEFANVGLMRFNDSHVPASMVAYGATGFAKQWNHARLIKIDNTSWPSWLRSSATDLETLQFSPSYHGENQVSSLFVGKRVATGVQQHLIANNDTPLAIVIMRLNASNQLEYLIYQTSSFKTLIADAGIGTDWEMLAAVFSRNATIEVRQGETGKTSATTDQSINAFGSTANAAVNMARPALGASGTFTGPCFMALNGRAVLSKAYTDTLSRAVKTPNSFAV